MDRKTKALILEGVAIVVAALCAWMMNKSNRIAKRSRVRQRSLP